MMIKRICAVIATVLGVQAFAALQITLDTKQDDLPGSTRLSAIKNVITDGLIGIDTLTKTNMTDIAGYEEASTNSLVGIVKTISESRTVSSNDVDKISRAVVSNVVTRGYVESLGIAGGGADTNVVRNLIDSSFTGGTNAVNEALGAYVTKDITNGLATASFVESSLSKKQDSLYTIGDKSFGEWKLGITNITITAMDSTIKVFTVSEIDEVEHYGNMWYVMLNGTVDGFSTYADVPGMGDDDATVLTNLQTTMRSRVPGDNRQYTVPVINGFIYRNTYYPHVECGSEVDKAPTENSNRVITSGGVKSSLDEMDARIALKYTKPASGISTNDLSESVRNSLSLANTAYQKPAYGIETNDLSNAVLSNICLGVTATNRVSIVRNDDRTMAVGGDWKLYDTINTSKFTCPYYDAVLYESTLPDGTKCWTGYSIIEGYTADWTIWYDKTIGEWWKKSVAFDYERTFIGGENDTTLNFGAPLSRLDKSFEQHFKSIGKAVPDSRTINGMPLTNNIVIASGITSNEVVQIVKSITNVVSYVSDNTGNVINADRTVVMAQAVPGGEFVVSELSYNNILHWKANDNGWYNTTIPPTVGIVKQNGKWVYINNLQGYGKDDIRFDGTEQVLPLYDGEGNPTGKTNTIRYVKAYYSYDKLATTNEVYAYTDSRYLPFDGSKPMIGDFTLKNSIQRFYIDNTLAAEMCGAYTPYMGGRYFLSLASASPFIQFIGDNFDGGESHESILVPDESHVATSNMVVNMTASFVNKSITNNLCTIAAAEEMTNGVMESVEASYIPSSRLTSGMTWKSGSSNWMNGTLVVGNTATLQCNNTAKVWFINPSNVKVGNGMTYATAPTLADYIADRVSGKQNKLVSGENIVTINGMSLLNSGNIDIGGGSTGTSNYNDLTNKPSINGYSLYGNVALENIGAAGSADLIAATNVMEAYGTHRQIVRGRQSDTSGYYDIGVSSSLHDSVGNVIATTYAVKTNTLEGYGITNAYTKQESDMRFAPVGSYMDPSVVTGIVQSVAVTNSGALNAAIADADGKYLSVDGFKKMEAAIQWQDSDATVEGMTLASEKYPFGASMLMVGAKVLRVYDSDTGFSDLTAGEGDVLTLLGKGVAQIDNPDEIVEDAFIGKLFVYTGSNTSSMTNGFIYRCISDGSGGYAYSRVDVQPPESTNVYTKAYIDTALAGKAPSIDGGYLPKNGGGTVNGDITVNALRFNSSPEYDYIEDEANGILMHVGGYVTFINAENEVSDLWVDGSQVLTEKLLKNTCPIITNAYTKQESDANYVKKVVDSEGNKTAITISTRQSGDIGKYSIAGGKQTKASSEYSHAEGNMAIASGKSSHAEGYLTTASGNCSHAEGDNSKAVGAFSHAEGGVCDANGAHSHADGYCAVANGDYTYAWNGVTQGYYSGNKYISHGPGTYNINPIGGIDGFYIGELPLSHYIEASSGGVGAQTVSNIATYVVGKYDETNVSARISGVWVASSNFTQSVYNDLDGRIDEAALWSIKESTNYTNSALSDKQDRLVSGSNIKTVNNSSILGNGNLNIEQIGNSTNVIYADGTWKRKVGNSQDSEWVTYDLPKGRNLNSNYVFDSNLFSYEGFAYFPKGIAGSCGIADSGMFGPALYYNLEYDSEYGFPIAALVTNKTVSFISFADDWSLAASKLKVDNTDVLTVGKAKCEWPLLDGVGSKTYSSVSNEIVAGSVSAVSTMISEKSDLTNLANAFSQTKTYVVGEWVTYGGKLYQCKERISTAGSWNPSKWDEKVVMSTLKDKTYDFSTAKGLYDGVRDLIQAFGGKVVNFPE